MKKLSPSKLFLIIFSIPFLLEFSSCCNVKEPKLTISDYGKSWISYAGRSVNFWDSSFHSVTFEYSDAVTKNIEGSTGEECGDYYMYEETSFTLTNSSDNLSFFFYLTPEGSGPPETIRIECQDEMPFEFYLRDDSILENPTSNFFIDTLIANARQYENVYVDTFFQNSFSVITLCYLTKENGIVGFKTTDGKLWIKE